ncbi:MAG: ABC transporter permease [candidate division WOR-3 bacterium]
MALSRLRSAIKKEFALLMRDRRLLAPLFIVPVVQVIILGYGATLDIKRIGAGICDMDMTSETRRLVSAMEATGYFRVKKVSDPRMLTEMLDRRQIVLGIVIPHGFTSGLEREIQVLVDGSNTSLGQTALFYFMGVFLKGFAGTIPIDDRVHILYNPLMKSSWFMVPGVVALVLLVFTMLLTAIAVVKEKEQGTLEQVIVTPMRPWEFVLSKTLPFVMVGAVQVSLVLAVAIVWFGIPFRGNIFTLVVFALLMIMSTLSLGLFISVITKTQKQAMMAAYFVAPVFVILSGFIIPVENMPRLSQTVAWLNPITYFLQAMRGIFLKGWGFRELWPQALILFIYGIILLSASTWLVRKRVL